MDAHLPCRGWGGRWLQLPAWILNPNFAARAKVTRFSPILGGISCVTSSEMQVGCHAVQCVVTVLLVLMGKWEQQQHERWGACVGSDGEGSGLELRRFWFGSRFSQRILLFLWSNHVNQLLELSVLLQNKSVALRSLCWALQLYTVQVLWQCGPVG